MCGARPIIEHSKGNKQEVETRFSRRETCKHWKNLIKALSLHIPVILKILNCAKYSPQFCKNSFHWENFHPYSIYSFFSFRFLNQKRIKNASESLFNWQYFFDNFSIFRSLKKHFFIIIKILVDKKRENFPDRKNCVSVRS